MQNPHQIIIQLATKEAQIPSKTDLRRWAKSAISKNIVSSEIVIRIVDVPEMIQLNEHYRKKKGATNVLSFDYREKNEDNIIAGDIIICAPVVIQEAIEQRKNQWKHWSLMIIHGCLHLQGFDHQTDPEANIMEQKEQKILSLLKTHGKSKS